MTTETEALRRAFEGYVNPDADIDLHWQAAGYYASRGLQTSWLDFQAGHAAAKAETADPVVGRWYFVANDGAATLCVDDADARESASEADIAFPRMAPHQVTQLVSASQLAAAVAKERERAATVCERIADDYNRQEGLKYPELKTDAETGADECADAIRAGAKEPSDG